MPCGRIGTVTFRVGAGGWRRARCVAHDPGGLGNPAAAPRDGRRAAAGRARWRCPRTRSCCTASPTCGFAAGDLHEPDARPPRFSRRHAAVLRRQAAAVRDVAGRRAGHRQRRRSARRRAGGNAAARDDLRDRSRRRRPRDRRSSRRSRDWRSASTRPRGPIDDAVAAGRPAQRLQHPRRRRLRRSRSTCRRGAIEEGIAAARTRARPLPDRLGDDRRRPRRRRLRAHRRRAEESARDGAAADDRAAHHGVRLRRRSRSHPSAR